MNFIVDDRIIKFGIVGMAGMCVDFATTWLLKEKIKINKFLANASGFILAVVNNFFLNSIWTFQNITGNTSSYFFKFILVSLVGLLINFFCLQFFVSQLKTNFYVLKLLVILIVFFWNYFVNLLFTFT